MPTIKLFANLRKVAGLKETSIPGSSIRAVVFELVKRFPALTEKLLENGEIRPHIIITVNGHPTTGMDDAVSEQDQIALFPPSRVADVIPLWDRSFV